jgi:hypothetical protein
MSDTFRKAYRELTDAEKEHVEQIKDAAERLEALILEIRTPGIAKAGLLGRRKALALTNLEQAVMWAVKAAT